MLNPRNLSRKFHFCLGHGQTEGISLLNDVFKFDNGFCLSKLSDRQVDDKFGPYRKDITTKQGFHGVIVFRDLMTEPMASAFLTDNEHDKVLINLLNYDHRATSFLPTPMNCLYDIEPPNRNGDIFCWIYELKKPITERIPLPPSLPLKTASENTPNQDLKQDECFVTSTSKFSVVFEDEKDRNFKIGIDARGNIVVTALGRTTDQVQESVQENIEKFKKAIVN